MRPSKSRSRGKSNRNRSGSVGNIVNRVFDSSGPEGKVRGTPQQIIDKYNQLARDAQLAGDRVATENFQQHAEHYLRMLAEAQREQDNKREQQERENRERQAERDRERAERQERDGNRDQAPQGNDQPKGNEGRKDGGKDSGSSPTLDVIETSDSEDSGLVETPESKPQRAPRKPRRKKDAQPESAGDDTESAAAE